VTRPLIAVAGRPLAAGKVSGWRSAAVGVGVAYVEALHRAGGEEAIMLPLELADDEAARRLARFDGLLLLGGGDVHPSLYGDEPLHPRLAGLNAISDAFEIPLARAAAAMGLPTLAICRGMQVLNVALGGTLLQHIESPNGNGPAATGSAGAKGGGATSGRAAGGASPAAANPGEPPVTDLVDRVPEPPEPHEETAADADWVNHGDPGNGIGLHTVRLAPGSLLAEFLGPAVERCTSEHHQAVARLGEGLRAVGWSPDGMVEAVELDRGWVIGVQWHPEVTAASDPAQQALFDALVRRAAGD
jgi:putative glutamine amidotransferase